MLLSVSFTEHLPALCPLPHTQDIFLVLAVCQLYVELCLTGDSATNGSFHMLCPTEEAVAPGNQISVELDLEPSSADTQLPGAVAGFFVFLFLFLSFFFF